ncbi:hypothetical protein D3C78_1153930 [compost metagenome]
MSNIAIIQRQFVRQYVAVLRIPRWMMCRVHGPGSALSLVLLAVLIHGNAEGLIINEENHICPFLDEWSSAAPGLLPKLELIAIIGSHFVRLFELHNLCVSSQDNIDARIHYVLKQIQKPSYLFRNVGIALTVSEIFYPTFVMSSADTVYTKHFCPINGVDDKATESGSLLLYPLDMLLEHLPA